SNYFPNLAAYFAGSTGSAVVVTTGVPCATGTVGSTGGGSATGTRTCSVAPGDVPAGTVIRTVEPSEAFASMDSPSLAPAGTVTDTTCVGLGPPRSASCRWSLPRSPMTFCAVACLCLNNAWRPAVSSRAMRSHAATPNSCLMPLIWCCFMAISVWSLALLASVPAVLKADEIPSDNLSIMLFSLGGAADICGRLMRRRAPKSCIYRDGWPGQNGWQGISSYML
ncbi:unnamed protein product, partial [Pelagomonas calceolata]